MSVDADKLEIKFKLRPKGQDAAQRKSPADDSVELEKIRRELLTLASRVDKLVKGQAQ